MKDVLGASIAFYLAVVIFLVLAVGYMNQRHDCETITICMRPAD